MLGLHFLDSLFGISWVILTHWVERGSAAVAKQVTRLGTCSETKNIRSPGTQDESPSTLRMPKAGPECCTSVRDIPHNMVPQDQKGELLPESVVGVQTHARAGTFVFPCLCTFQMPVYKRSPLNLGHNRSLAHKGESEGKRWCLVCGPQGCQAWLSVPGYLFEESWQLAVALVICPLLLCCCHYL